ncbi:MAG: hypothetical protein ACT4PJ_05700 [Gemmatimonadaceae bacterium]
MTTAALVTTGRDRLHSYAIRLGRAGELLWAATLIGLLGWILVQPWKPVPFPIVDFGGWLAILSSSESAAHGFRALVEEHAREGRLNILSMAYVGVNWALFGDQPLGWQLVRAAILVGVVGAAYALFRALGARRVAAMAGAAFFVVSDAARSVWLWPQAMEHVATALVLIAALFAISYHEASRPWRPAVAIAAALVLAIWVREPMVSAVPFVLLLALCHRGDGRFVMPVVDRRTSWLVSITAVAITLLNAIPILAIRTVELTSGYAARFGPENISVANVENVLAALVLPVTREPLFPANALFLMVIAAAAFGPKEVVRRYRAVLLLAATLPLCAAVIYVMWPSFPGNYALPYVPAIALAFSLALTTLWTGSRIQRGIAVVGTGVVLGYGVLLTVNGRRDYTASRLLDADMAQVVSESSSSQLTAAVDDPRLSGEYGRGLLLYASATRGRAPEQASDVDCASAAQLAAMPPSGVTLIRPPGACANASFPPPSRSLTRTLSIIDWKALRPTDRMAKADFWYASPAQ